MAVATSVLLLSEEPGDEGEFLLQRIYPHVPNKAATNRPISTFLPVLLPLGVREDGPELCEDADG